MLAIATVALAAQLCLAQPVTPCPCAADGHCLPQGPWGYTQTQWRRWPGDEIQRPDEIVADEEERGGKLEDIEYPLPEKEGLRGPEPQENRRRRRRNPDEAAAAEQPGAALEAPIPGVGPGAEQPFEPGLGLPPEVQPAQPEAGLEQPVDEQPGIDLGQPVEEQPQPEEDAEDFFDPFSQLEVPLRMNPKPNPETTQAPQPAKASGPPPLPSSLMKFSRTLQPKTPVYARVKQHDRYRSSTMALAR